MFTALRFVLAGDRPVRTLAVGALLSSLGVLLLPGIFVAGFYGRVLARSAAGRPGEGTDSAAVTDPSSPDDPSSPRDPWPAEEALPGFTEWRTLGMHGLKTWLAAALYLSASGVIALGFGGVALALGGTFGNGFGATLGVLTYVLLAATALGVLSLPVWFFMPVALTRLALTGRVSAALELRTVLRTAVRPAYLARWLAGIALLAVGWSAYLGLSFGLGELVAGSGLAVGIGGHLGGAAVNFTCQVLAFSIFGRGYAAAVRGSDHDPLLDDVTAQITTPRDEGWGHDGRLPPWGELRDGERAGALADD